MNSSESTHIVPYRTYVAVLLVLFTFTSLSILVTSFNLGPWAVSAALLFSTLKTTLVFLIFMHLRFDQKIYGIMVLVVLTVFFLVIIITFLDYYYR